MTNKFTKGPWLEDGGDVYADAQLLGALEICLINKTFINYKGNAKLIAAAGTSASKLAEMGYDAQKVMELLPEIFKEMEAIASLTSICSGILKKVKP